MARTTVAASSSSRTGGKGGPSGGMDKKQIIMGAVAALAILGTLGWLLSYYEVFGSSSDAPPPTAVDAHLTEPEKKAAEKLRERQQEADRKIAPAGS